LVILEKCFGTHVIIPNVPGTILLRKNVNGP
jgi:hypothetical protein